MSEIGNDIKLGLGAAGVIAPLIPIPLAQAIIVLVARYGPEIIDRIEAVLAKPDINLEDMKNIFADLRPYEAFGIPDIAPTAPDLVPASPAPAPAVPGPSPAPDPGPVPAE